MKSPKTDIDSLVEVLRGDFPSCDDEARIRARLLAAGVVVTIAATTTTSAAGASVGGTVFGAAALSSTSVGATATAPSGLVKVGLLAKVLALPLAGKIGAATTVAVVVAASSLPVISRLHETATQHAARVDVAVSSGSGTTSAARVTAQASDPVLSRAQAANAGVVGAQAALPADEPATTTVEPAIAAVASPAPSVRSTALAGQVLAATSAVRSSSPSAQPVLRTQASLATQPASGTPLPLGTPSPVVPGQVEAAAAVALEPSPAAGELTRGEMARASEPSTLREETRLMAQAIAALGQGDRARARRSLGEHAWRFPNGVLAPERERALERLRSLDQGAGQSAH